jgi:hypothetical protein
LAQAPQPAGLARNVSYKQVREIEDPESAQKQVKGIHNLKGYSGECIREEGPGWKIMSKKHLLPTIHKNPYHKLKDTEDVK